MHRIDSDGTVNALPTPDAVGGTVGYFQKGDPVAGQKATVVTADWANAVQEEIINVVLQSGLTPNKTVQNQLYLAIQAISAAAKYKHPQVGALTTWTITHNFNSKDHMIQLFDSNDKPITDADDITRGLNTTTVNFSIAQAGSALLIKIA